MPELTQRERDLAGGFHDHSPDIEMLNIIECGSTSLWVAKEVDRLNAWGAYGHTDWTPDEVVNAAEWAFQERGRH